jgi:hypothetical protein
MKTRSKPCESFMSGVRYCDTAPFYGFGLSEQQLGTALAGEHTPLVLSTKVGQADSDRSTGRQRRTRRLLFAAPIRAGVRLQLRLDHAFACREPRTAGRAACRHLLAMTSAGSHGKHMQSA